MAKKSKQVQEAGAAARAGNDPAASLQARRAARRPDQIRRQKDERRQQFEKQQKQWLYTKIAIGAVALAVVGALAWGAFGQFREWQVSRDVETYFGANDFVGSHTADEPVLYEQVPPVGGWHRPAGAWQNCGFYAEYIENERGVHSLEHGAVWITYDPDLPEGEIATLREKAESSSKVLVSPYPGMDAPVIASVWGKQIKLDGADNNRLDPFISRYLNNPGNTPEIGGICWSGISVTTDQVPQQEPFIRAEGTDPIGGIPVSAATATAQAELGIVATPGDDGTPETAATEVPVIGPDGTPVGTPVGADEGTPEATPAGTPESTPAT